MTITYHPSSHPTLPPTTEDERLSWLRLLRSRRVGISTFFRLIGEHGSADAALNALPEIAQQAGVQNYAPCPVEAVQTEIDAGRKIGACLIAIGEPDYPQALAQISDPPPLIWIKGRQDLLNAPSVGMVGARNASALGSRMARSMAKDLGEQGFVTISGLARGIDTAVHQATLDHGTIAVLGGGVDVKYPAENAHLLKDIYKKGVAISEQPIGMPPQARHFPLRNRIISGMSRALIVVEAAAKSGSLITARNALDQGRDILAVPGHPFDARASGCNMLIRDGATLVRNASDVIEAVGAARSAPLQTKFDYAPPTQDKRSRADTQDLHQQILNRLGPTPLPEDQLVRDIGQSARDVGSALATLELEHEITRAPGGLISRLKN